MAVPGSANIYVFDDGNSRIVKLDPLGKLIAEFGQPGSGAGAIVSAGLNDSVAVDHDEKYLCYRFRDSQGTNLQLRWNIQAKFSRSVSHDEHRC